MESQAGHTRRLGDTGPGHGIPQNGARGGILPHHQDAVYRRGAQFMRDLRETMGDPAFFGFVEEYQRRYSSHLAKAPDFFGVVQEFTTADLIPLQEEYFRQRIRPLSP